MLHFRFEAALRRLLGVRKLGHSLKANGCFTRRSSRWSRSPLENLSGAPKIVADYAAGRGVEIMSAIFSALSYGEAV